jgi:acetyl esterase
MDAILREQQANPAPDPATLPIERARRDFLANNVAWNRPLPPMLASDETLGSISCRKLSPEGARPGLVVFVHGGGWTFGAPESHERFARLLAEQAKVEVLLPDYRLAPEHPAPAAIEDVLAVLGALRPDGPVVLCGDSAGANIALAAALSRPALRITLLSLLYGCFAPVFDTGSHQRNGDGRFGLSTPRMRWYWSNWLGHAQDVRAVPLHAELIGLPPCHLLAAGLDPLCDDSLMLADRLAAAGVPTRLDIVPGVVHGFLQMTARLEPARRATAAIATEIAAAMNRAGLITGAVEG